ncbi:ABC transporter ATP-binding protein [Streptomyces radiopugnans]|uniref:ABC transporter ATP-binding protein n=2 Tax=Streptomyces TaxID=1883 RepID=UPI003F1B85AC
MRLKISLLKRLGLVGGPVLTLLLLIKALQALVPAATALSTGALVSAVDSVAPAQSDPWQHILVPLVALGAVLLAGQTLNAVLSPVRALAKGRIDGAHRASVAALAISAGTLTELEDPEVQDLIRTSAAEQREWVEKTPGDGALGLLDLVMRHLQLVASAVVLASFSIWLIPLLVMPALAVRTLARRQWLRHFRIWVGGISHNRRSAYWSEIAASPAEAKESRIFGFGEWLVERRLHHMHAHMTPVWEDDLRAVRWKWVQFALAVVPMALVFFAVGYGTARGHATVAEEAAVLSAAWGVFNAVVGTQELIGIEGSLPVVAAYERLVDALGRPERTLEREDGPPYYVRKGPPPLVRFEHVEFTYPGADRPVLAALDLEIRPGELLAVVGLNGAGKSTLVKLLAGLHRPTDGRITADGCDIADPSTGGIPGWRRSLSIVFQDFVRYHLSAHDNVALGYGHAGPTPDNQESVSAVARETGLRQVVDRLPQGWDTPLSRRRTGGVDLSGGQWQQVALARALYATRAGASILVLDEPTAHLDVRTEFAMFRKLAHQTPGVSVVLISHRLSTVRQADRIVLLADGRIVESGSHAELMRQGGAYARMFDMQAEQFTADTTAAEEMT